MGFSPYSLVVISVIVGDGGQVKGKEHLEMENAGSPHASKIF